MEQLTPQEENAMHAVWKIGEANIKAFLDVMDNPPPYTTLASTLRNLERKKYLKSRQVGNIYLYKPIISEKSYKKVSVAALVKTLFGNSYKEMVNFFVDQKALSTKELKDIIRIIENEK